MSVSPGSTRPEETAAVPRVLSSTVTGASLRASVAETTSAFVPAAAPGAVSDQTPSASAAVTVERVAPPA